MVQIIRKNINQNIQSKGKSSQKDNNRIEVKLDKTKEIVHECSCKIKDFSIQRPKSFKKEENKKVKT